MRLQIVTIAPVLARRVAHGAGMGRCPTPRSLSFGWLGASARLFDLVALEALRRRGASRQVILDAIGRGIGRVAAHDAPMIHC